MNEALRARLAEIDAQPAENLTRGAAASLAAAEAMDDGTATHETLKEDEKIKITRSKYSCFSASYIEDAAAMLKDPVMIFKSYQTGTNGKVYA